VSVKIRTVYFLGNSKWLPTGPKELDGLSPGSRIFPYE